MNIISPSDPSSVKEYEPQIECSYCGVSQQYESNEKWRDDVFEWIETVDHRGPVILCRKCYKKAGNSVR